MNATKSSAYYNAKYESYIAEQFKTTDDIANNSYGVVDAIKKDIKTETENNTVSMQKIVKIANDLIKREKLDCRKITTYSGKEKAEREKLHTRAAGAFSVGMAKFIATKAAFEKTSKMGTDNRGLKAIICGLCKDSLEEKKIVDAINGMHDGDEEKKKFLGEWYNDKLRKVGNDIKEFRYEKSNSEMLEYAENNFPLLMALMEVEKGSCEKVANDLGLKLDPDVSALMKDVAFDMVDVGVGVCQIVGCMANPCYPELDLKDFDLMHGVLEYGKSERLFYENELEVVGKLDEPSEEYAFAPYEEYRINIASLVFGKEKIELAKLENDINMREAEATYDDLKRVNDKEEDPAKKKTEEEMRAKQNEEVEAQKIRSANTLQTCSNGSIDKFKPYVNRMIKDRTETAPESVKYSFEGKELGEKEAMLAALSGKRVQAFDPQTETNPGKYLFTLSASNNGFCVPVKHGNAAKWDFEGMIRTQQKTGNGDITRDANQKIQNVLATMYKKLEKGSRFYISSKGDYGQLMSQIKATMNGDFSDREKLESNINQIKATANAYFMNRLGKEKRSDLAVQREEAVENVLQSFGKEFEDGFKAVKDFEKALGVKKDKEPLFDNISNAEFAKQTSKENEITNEKVEEKKEPVKTDIKVEPVAPAQN